MRRAVVCSSSVVTCQPVTLPSSSAHSAYRSAKTPRRNLHRISESISAARSSVWTAGAAGGGVHAGAVAEFRGAEHGVAVGDPAEGAEGEQALVLQADFPLTPPAPLSHEGRGGRTSGSPSPLVGEGVGG